MSSAATDVLLSLERVGKDYPVVQGWRRWALLVAAWRRQPSGAPVHTALHDVTLQVRRGESLGIIGVNGAGKSTLLKLVAGVARPSRGTVQRRGSVGALLELGAGFHPEHSGRDNALMALALHGMGAAQARAALPAIEAFADIGAHWDRPIKTYSSGMVVRVGFAVMTALRPDLLITDEVLAVGDEAFQKKCIAWMEGYLADGGTLLLVSHGMYHVQKLCRHALWLDHGRVQAWGDALEVTRQYLAWHERRAATGVHAAAAAAPQALAQPYRVVRWWVNGAQVEGAVRWPMGQAGLTVSGVVRAPDGGVPHVAVGLARADGAALYGVTSDMQTTPGGGADPAQRLHRLDALHHGFALRFEALPLLPGEYELRLHAMDASAMRVFDEVKIPLHIVGQTRELGTVRLPHRWLPAAQAQPLWPDRSFITENSP